VALETVAEANKYARTQLMLGVREAIVAESPILNLLPFAEILGNSLTYNRESTLGAAQFFNPGDTWVESTPTLTQVVATLRILGGDADVDKFLALTRSNEQDLRAEVIGMKTKALARQFQDSFVYGEAAVDPKAFDGVHVIAEALAAAQNVHLGTGSTPAVGTFSQLDALLDTIVGGPDALVMSRRTRRGIQKLARSQGWGLQVQPVGALGFLAQHWAGVPIFVNDFMVDTELLASGKYSAKTGGASLFGLEAGGGIQVEDVGALETKDAQRTRIKWYCGLALLSSIALGRLDGLSSGDWTN
jgi:HK97 family phage major capsid protein